MCLDDLYRQYGELLFQQELTQSAINNVKQAIVNEINKQGTPLIGTVTEEPKPAE